MFKFHTAELVNGSVVDDWLDLQVGEDGTQVQGSIRVSIRSESGSGVRVGSGSWSGSEQWSAKSRSESGSGSE